MPSGRIDDELFANPKFCFLLSLKGGGEALGLWTVADSWCNNQLTDGHVPTYMLAKLGPFTEKHAELLQTAKLWHKTECGWLFHDWGDFNETRQSVLEKRAKEAEKKGHQRLAKRTRDALSRMVSPGDTQGDSPPVSPERPALLIPIPIPPLATQEDTRTSEAPADQTHRPSLVAVRREPARLLTELERLTAEEFYRRKTSRRGAGTAQRLKACERADDAVALGHFESPVLALGALVCAAAAESLRPGGRAFGFALEQVEFGPGASPVAGGDTSPLTARLAELRNELKTYQSGPKFSPEEQHRVEREITKVERQIRELEPKRAESYAR